MLVLDSCIWIAFWNTTDSQHEKAVDLFSSNDEEVLLPEYILVEVLNVLLLKANKKAADLWLKKILNSEWVRILPSTPNLLKENLDYFLKNKHSKLSFIDQSLVILSRKYQVLTFDKELAKNLNS